MNLFIDKLSDLINVDDESPNSTSKFPVSVDIAIQHRYRFRGEIIASGVPLLPLKVTAPKLLQYLTIDGTRIVLPRNEAIDQDLLLNMIDLIVCQHRSGEDFDIDVHELPQDPVKLIKLHIMLELCGLIHQAQNLVELLWAVFKTHTLTLKDVFWIWGALHPHKSIKWVPESANAYVRMMAWNILNGDVEDKLHPELRTFFLKEEARPYHLTCLLEQHYQQFGLGHGPQAVPRERRDTATERTDVAASPYSLLTPVSGSASVKESIFPAKWLSPPEPEKQPKPTVADSLLLNEKWTSNSDSDKWDGKVKIVKEMTAEREGLAWLRRKQAFLDIKSNPPLVRGLSIYLD